MSSCVAGWKIVNPTVPSRDVAPVDLQALVDRGGLCCGGWGSMRAMLGAFQNPVDDAQMLGCFVAAYRREPVQWLES